MNKVPMPTDASIITTYRCCMKCKMCNIWKYPTDIDRELKPEDLEKLPQLKFINITGGEPFVRRDLADLIEVAFRKAPRVVISTAGYQVNEILTLAERFPKIGIRVSIEGLSTINDYLRGRDSGFDRGLRTLTGLRRMGIKDIGFGITVSNNNSSDMLELYELSKNLGMEFATASYHNSYYFHKENNHITNQDEVTENFYELIDRLLKENKPKSWFRAFFNHGLINYIKGNRRFLPCEAGTVNFFIEPYGDVFPCNGLEDKYWKESMGNIRDVDTFEEIWYSQQANRVRSLVKTCPKNCWMVGTAAPVMKKYIRHPLGWVIKHKLRSLLGKKIDRDCLPKPYDVGQHRSQGDLRLPDGAPRPADLPPDELVTPDNRWTMHVLEKEMLAADVCRLKLERRNFQFVPGQNASLGPCLKYHRNRDYTFSSGIHDDFLEFMIKILPKGDVSQFVQSLEVGQTVDIVGPYNDFLLDEPDNNNIEHLFIASGVGISPFHSFRRSYPDLKYRIIHGIRKLSEKNLALDMPPDHYFSCVSREEGGDYHGRVTDYLNTIEIPENVRCYVCGNPRMVKDTLALLKKKSVPVERIFIEVYYAY